MIKLKNILNEGKLNKKDVAYQLSIDYSGNTKPKVTKLNNKGMTVFYGYKVNPKDVIKSLNKLEPSIKIKHRGWSNISTGGGTHTFVFEAKLEKEKFTEPEEMRNEARPMFQKKPNEIAYIDFKKWAYKNRSTVKNILLKAVKDGRDPGTDIFLALRQVWLAWANKNAKDFSSIPNKGPAGKDFGRALAVMMKKDNLIINKSTNKLTDLK